MTQEQICIQCGKVHQVNASTCDECKWKDKEVLAKWVKATVGFLFVALVEFIIILFLLKS